MRNNSTKKIVRLALFLALGVVLNIIESMLPVLIVRKEVFLMIEKIWGSGSDSPYRAACFAGYSAERYKNTYVLTIPEATPLAVGANGSAHRFLCIEVLKADITPQK